MTATLDQQGRCGKILEQEFIPIMIVEARAGSGGVGLPDWHLGPLKVTERKQLVTFGLRPSGIRGSQAPTPSLWTAAAHGLRDCGEPRPDRSRSV